MQVTEELFRMQDEAYKAFTEKLVPNVDPTRIIGVRMPELRRFAKAFAKTPQADAFLRALRRYIYSLFFSLSCLYIIG